MSNRDDKEPIALEAYEKLAESYAALTDTKPHNAYYERPATLSLLPDLAGKRVFDAGCGPGFYAEWLVNHGAEAVSADVSPKMVEITRKRLGPRAEVHLADLSKPLDFLNDADFDLVLAPLVMDYIEDWHGVFTEFHRVLRDGGLFVFSGGHPWADFAITRTENYFATELFYYTWTGFGEPVDVPSYRRPLEAMIAPLWDAGFVIERIIEPRPTEEFKVKDPEGYEKLSKNPGFMCIRARKDAVAS